MDGDVDVNKDDDGDHNSVDGNRNSDSEDGSDDDKDGNNDVDEMIIMLDCVGDCNVNVAMIVVRMLMLTI